jgi:hypothetical protein
MEKENTLSFYDKLISSKLYLPIAGDKFISPNEGGFLVMRASNCRSVRPGYFLTEIKYIEKNLIEKADYRHEESWEGDHCMSPHDFIIITRGLVFEDGYKFIPHKNDERRFLDMIGWSIRVESLNIEDDLKDKRTSIAINRLKHLGWSDDDIQEEIQQKTDSINKYFSKYM